MSHFGLGKYADGVNALQRLDVLLVDTGADPQPHPYQDYTDNSAPDNLGVPIQVGPPKARWHWDWLSQRDLEALLAICPGQSAPVYLRTEVNRGVLRGFEVFSGTMLAPVLGDPLVSPAGLPPYPQMRGPVDIDFILLVSV